MRRAELRADGVGRRRIVLVTGPAAPPPAEALSRSHSPWLSRAVRAQASAVAVSGLYAYVTGRQSNSLVVVDISNPASPVIRGSVVSSSLLGGSFGVAVSGTYAYVVAPISDSLVVVDVSNPASPVIRGSVVSSSLMDAVRVRRGAAGAAASGAAACVAPSIMLVVRGLRR